MARDWGAWGKEAWASLLGKDGQGENNSSKKIVYLSISKAENIEFYIKWGTLTLLRVGWGEGGVAIPPPPSDLKTGVLNAYKRSK